MSTVDIEHRDDICIVTIDRPAARNAVDGPTARALADAFRAFDADDALSVAILRGAGEHFCGGADLKAAAGGLDGKGTARAWSAEMRADDRWGRRGCSCASR